ncbi:amino acid deaminase [soil metagenome]
MTSDANIHEDFETPFASIDLANLNHNAETMHAWVASHGAELWPHAKTVMSRELVDLQLDAGSVGMTAATMAQVRSLRDWGVHHVMLANQLVQPSAAAWIAQQQHGHPEHRFWSFIDSVEGIAVLEAAAIAADSEFEVLVEVGMPGGRTGVRSVEQLDALATALASTPHVRAIGVAAYEGACAGDRGTESLAAVDAYLTRVADYLARLVEAGVVPADVAVFSAGGSMFFDRVTAAIGALPFRPRVVVRSGCYLLHDDGLYARSTPLPDSDAAPGLRAALTVWGTVHSRPEPTRAYVDVGRRDASFDQGPPVPLRRLPLGASQPVPLVGVSVCELNDHHAHLDVPAGVEIAIGDRIEFGISHPCTTMDKWRTIPLVADGGRVVSTIHTEF